MPQSIEYQKLMTEIVYINLPGPSQPTDGMTGGELLHGFLSDLYTASNPDTKSFVMTLCNKWNVRFVQPGGATSHDTGKRK
jgi:phosphoketolase